MTIVLHGTGQMGVWTSYLIKKYEYLIFGIFFGTSRFGTGTVLVVPNFFWAQFMVPVPYRVFGVGAVSVRYQYSFGLVT